MGTFERAIAAGRELGWRALLHYARYQLALKSGWLRSQTPVYDWHDKPTSTWVTDKVYQPQGRFIFESHHLEEIKAFHQPSSFQAADDILDGRFSLFGLPPVQLRYPPDWWGYPPMAEASMGDRVLLDRHWSSIDVGQFTPDVK